LIKNEFVGIVVITTTSTTQGSIRSMNSTDHERIYDLQGRARNFTRLDRLSCLKLYVDPLNTTSDVILVAKNLTSAQNNGSSLVQGWINGLTSWDYANFWVCGGAQKDHVHQNDYCTLDWALSFASKVVRPTTNRDADSTSARPS
jgi:hypothetical protein